MNKTFLFFTAIIALSIFPEISFAEHTMAEYRQGCSDSCGAQFAMQDPEVKGNTVVCLDDTQTMKGKGCNQFGSVADDKKWCVTHETVAKNKALKKTFQCLGIAETAAK